MTILQRKELMDYILDFKADNHVKMIRGVRGAGKTTLLKSMAGELENRGVDSQNIFYISLLLHDFRNKNHCDVWKELKRRFEGIEGKIYLFFDDVEYFDEWRQLLDSFRIKGNFEVYVAVNYSRFHNPPERNPLGGRTFDFELYPFSFKEFVEYKKLCDSKKSIQELFDEYVEFGGMPDIVTEEDIAIKDQVLENIINIVKYQDLAKNTECEPFLADKFLEYMISTFTEKFSHEKINRQSYDIFDSDTLRELKHHLKHSDFMHASQVPFYSFRCSWDEKYYLTDHGFFSRLSMFSREYIDEILKNIIYIELLRRGYKVFFTEKQEKYVDFIATKWNKRVYIQFDRVFATDSIIRREVDFLNYHAWDRDKYIITAGNYDLSGYGVRHLNIIDFLLGDEI